MMGFIFLSFSLLVIVIWLIAPALLGRKFDNFDDNKQLNINIAKERLAELDTQLKNNEIDQNQYNQIKNEIEASLLDDTDEQKDAIINKELPAHYKRTILVLLTAIPFSAFALYQYWGSPDTLTNTAAPGQISTNQTTGSDTSQNKHSGSLSEAITKLEARLAAEPNNPDGWFMLARSYSVQKQYQKSAEAFRKLHTLVGDQPVVLLGLADMLTMSRNGDMSGEPFELAKKALAIEPDNITALWLTGMGYNDAGDIPRALELLQRLLPLLSDDAKSSQEIRILIANAQRKLGIKAEQTNVAANTTTPSTQTDQSTARLIVKVKIDPALRSSLADSDYVMIYAQRVTGMKMPLAIVKMQVKDMPMTITLDDSLAAGPMGKLSDAAQVNVLARISKSGQAIRQSGDIEVKRGPYINNHAEPIEITIK